MKRRSKSKTDYSHIKPVFNKKKGNRSIPFSEIIRIISHLGTNVTELDHDGRWRSTDSLWSKLADNLAVSMSIKNTIAIRKYIYATWHRESSMLRSHFITEPLQDSKTNLQELASVPSYSTVSTRSNTTNSSDKDDDVKNVQQHLIQFSYDRWRQVYKKDEKKVGSHYMDPSWSDLFYDELIAHKLITCSLVFTRSRLRKKNSRKWNAPLFKCHARCQNLECPVTVDMVMGQNVTSGKNVVFRVEIKGDPRHDDASGYTSRPLKGARRVQLAQAALDQGILKTYERNLVNADDDLLKAKNRTQVPSIDVVKIAAQELANTNRLHPDMFIELHMILQSMLASDDKPNDDNKANSGYIRTLQLWPFAATFYTQTQLSRFIEYCLSTQDSYIYVDATGSVVKALPDQRKPYLYLICFKDDQDASNLLPLAGALLTDHSAASILGWLSIVRRDIAAIKEPFVRPNYIVIDFSPALLNAVLLAFNNTNINSYLRWCFNAVQKNYSSKQLHSMSCIRLCCSHTMHAFTRALSKLKIDKKIRLKATMLFGVLLNCNELDQIYELIGFLVCVFGSPDLTNAEELIDAAIQAVNDCNFDFETFFVDDEIGDGEHLILQEMATLDDNFLSSEPILHQSPFTKLARERSPNLSRIIDQRKETDKTKITNSFFSTQLIRVFYKWIAYLPLFTGLMHGFQARYASDIPHDSKSRMYGCGRVSNAAIESFFKILKHSILRRQTNIRPAEFLIKMYTTTKARLKAKDHNLGQKKPRKRKRSTKRLIDVTAVTEKWKKKGTNTKSRDAYFTRFVEPTLTAKDIRNRLREKLQIRQNHSDNINGNEDTSYVDAIDTPCTDVTNAPNLKCIESDKSDQSQLLPSVQDEPSHQKISTVLADNRDMEDFDSPTFPSSQSKVVLAQVYDKNINNDTITNMSSDKKDKKHNVIEFTIPKDWPTHVVIDNLRLKFPHYSIGPTFFDGKRYSASNTCSLDSSLFLLYYIFKSKSNEFRMLFNQAVPVLAELKKTFDYVEKDDWNIARLYWISTYTTHPDRNNLAQHHNLHGTADTNVLQYVREIQKYIIQSTCNTMSCPKYMRTSHSVDIAMPQISRRNRGSAKLSAFCNKYTTSCGVTIGPDEPTSYNGSYSRDDHFPAQNGNETRTMFLCDSGRMVKAHHFVHPSPPILLLNVGQVKFDAETHELVAPIVKDLPFTLSVGKQRYCLAGAICPHADHFTATIVRAKGKYSKYDDLYKWGVKNNDGADDSVGTAIYALDTDNDYVN